jgi:uncharacterized protein (TIGR02996 family)
MTRLEAGLAALAAGDWAIALDALLAVWAGHRAPALAHLIELVDRCALGFDRDDVVVEDAAALAAAGVVERGRLLRALGRGSDLSDPGAWVDTLLALPPDPRVAAVLWDISHRLPLAMHDADDDGISDPELDLGDPLTARWREVCRHHFDERVNNVPHGEPALELEHPDELLPAETTRVLAAELALRRRLFDDAVDRDVVAPFAANPRDDGARGVYADWLQQRGDRRGDALHGIAGGPPPWKVEPLWLGPLARIANHVRFDRGRAVQVRFDDPDEVADWAALETGWRPGWAGIEALDRPPASLLAQVPLPALSALLSEYAPLAAAVASGARFPALATLKLARWYAGPLPERDEIAVLQGLLRQLPGLRALELYWAVEGRDTAAVAAAFEPLLREPCVPALALNGRCHNWLWVPAPQWLRALRTTASPLRAFSATGDAGERWRFGHTADDRVDWQRVRMEWWGRSPNEHNVARVAELLAVGDIPVLELVAKEPLQPGIAALVRALPGEVALTIDPDLPGP